MSRMTRAEDDYDPRWDEGDEDPQAEYGEELRNLERFDDEGPDHGSTMARMTRDHEYLQKEYRSPKLNVQEVKRLLQLA